MTNLAEGVDVRDDNDDEDEGISFGEIDKGVMLAALKQEEICVESVSDGEAMPITASIKIFFEGFLLRIFTTEGELTSLE